MTLFSRRNLAVAAMTIAAVAVVMRVPAARNLLTGEGSRSGGWFSRLFGG